MGTTSLMGKNDENKNIKRFSVKQEFINKLLIKIWIIANSSEKIFLNENKKK